MGNISIGEIYNLMYGAVELRPFIALSLSDSFLELED